MQYTYTRRLGLPNEKRLPPVVESEDGRAWSTRNGTIVMFADQDAERVEKLEPLPADVTDAVPNRFSNGELA